MVVKGDVNIETLKDKKLTKKQLLLQSEWNHLLIKWNNFPKFSRSKINKQVLKRLSIEVEKPKFQSLVTPGGNTAKPTTKIYTGLNLIGIATMHKSNLVPIKTIIEETPPELISDVMQKGIILAGGGSLIRGLDKLIANQTEMPVRMMEDPLTAVVRGTGIVLEDLGSLRDVLIDNQYEKSFR